MLLTRISINITNLFNENSMISLPFAKTNIRVKIKLGDFDSLPAATTLDSRFKYKIWVFRSNLIDTNITQV